jgi:hypothetical protein
LGGAESFPLNREKITDDGARYFTADWEWFVLWVIRKSDLPIASGFVPASGSPRRPLGLQCRN